jgi:DNA-binding transcriptional LysR family regulator
MIDQRLRSFIVFGEELNFTRAGTRLHVSQPALHVQVKRLEAEVGFPVYQRVGRSIVLTPQGRALLAFARDLRERSDAFLAELGGATPQRLVLAAGEGVLLYALGPALRQAAQWPDVKLRVLTRDREGTLAAVAAAEAHLGVTALDTAPEHVAATPLRRVGMLLVMPRGHRLARKRRVRLADLAGERLIVPPAGRPHRELVTRALASAGVEWEPALEAAGWEVMLHYAALGVGLAIVNDICRVPAGATARPLSEIPALRYYVLHRTQLPLSPPAEHLRRLIIETLAARERRARGIVER